MTRSTASHNRTRKRTKAEVVIALGSGDWSLRAKADESEAWLCHKYLEVTKSVNLTAFKSLRDGNLIVRMPEPCFGLYQWQLVQDSVQAPGPRNPPGPVPDRAG